MCEWLRVSKHFLCPVCNEDSWCTYTSDAVIKCMRVQSPNAHEKGGWFHFDKPVDLVWAPQQPKPEPVDAQPVAIDCYKNECAAEARACLAEQLGVTEESLDQLRVGVGRDHDGTHWYSFPSRDGNGKVVGITRRYLDGSKKTLKGTSGGIFFAPNWHEYPGPALIVEGASDVAAAMSAGLCAIGRSSNVGGILEIKCLLDRHDKKAIVVGERDEKPHKRGTKPWCPEDCTGCQYCYPGLYGAIHTSKQLGVPYAMTIEPYKDLRSMLAGGCVWTEIIKAIA